MSAIKGFLIDRDGVLTITNGEFSWENTLGRYRLAKYVDLANRNKFPKIGICTGREYGSAETILFDIGLPDWWSIIESGVFLFNRRSKKILENPELTKEIKEAFDEISRKRIPPIFKKHENDLFLYPGNQICIAIELQEKAKFTIEQAYREIFSQIQDIVEEGLATIHHSSIAVDISPAKIDKESGVKFLCQVEEIDSNQIFAIGDSPGDFPMFRAAGQIGCPSNATSECKEMVKKRKGIISEKPYAAGVIDILYRATGVRIA